MHISVPTFFACQIYHIIDCLCAFTLQSTKLLIDVIFVVFFVDFFPSLHTFTFVGDSFQPPQTAFSPLRQPSASLKQPSIIYISRAFISEASRILHNYVYSLDLYCGDRSREAAWGGYLRVRECRDALITPLSFPPVLHVKRFSCSTDQQWHFPSCRRQQCGS